MSEVVKNTDGKFVALCFVSFFAVIVIVNSIFIYMSIITQPGVVTDHAYEKGLNHNATLELARSQPEINQEVSYVDGVLRWKLFDKYNQPINNAIVRADIIRPVKRGSDFDVMLEYKGAGIYEVMPSLPMKGLWLAKLSGKWDSKKYQTTYKFIAK